MKKIPNELEPVLAKISHQSDLGNTQWYEVVYYVDGKWCSYSGSKTFDDGEIVEEWVYCSEQFKQQDKMKREKQLTAVEWLQKELFEKFVLSDTLLFIELIAKAKEIEEQQQVEFAFKAYSEMLSSGKSFIDVVNSMRTFNQAEQ